MSGDVGEEAGSGGPEVTLVFLFERVVEGTSPFTPREGQMSEDLRADVDIAVL